jgi:hypothetical protein
VTATNFSNQTIPAGTTVTVTDLYIGGGTYTVKGSLIVNGELTLEPGATLEVIDGDLTINGSTLSGTFTFFNSMGSVDFNSDIEITTGANGLILISDVHVAKDAVITVDGSLVIDGCVVDCKTPGGPYTIAVQSGASFTMARTLMIDGVLNLAAADSKVYDNQFENTTVTVAAGTSGARVYHNLTGRLPRQRHRHGDHRRRLGQRDRRCGHQEQPRAAARPGWPASPAAPRIWMATSSSSLPTCSPPRWTSAPCRTRSRRLRCCWATTPTTSPPPASGWKTTGTC